jgi:hypothetical protein
MVADETAGKEANFCAAMNSYAGACLFWYFTGTIVGARAGRPPASHSCDEVFA